MLVEVPSERILDRGMTPNEAAKLFRVSPDQIRDWVRDGTLGAIDTSRRHCGKPRFVILPCHVAAFTAARAAAQPQKLPRRRRQAAIHDYYADDGAA